MAAYAEPPGNVLFSEPQRIQGGAVFQRLFGSLRTNSPETWLADNKISLCPEATETPQCDSML